MPKECNFDYAATFLTSTGVRIWRQIYESATVHPYWRRIISMVRTANSELPLPVHYRYLEDQSEAASI